MADDKLFFKQVAKVHPKFGTPYVAIMLVAAMGVAFVLLQTFEKLTDTYVIAVLPFYALGVAAVFPLRKKPGYAPSFKTPGYPVVPLLFIASTIFLLGNSVLEPGTRIWTLGIFGVILAGIPFYWLVAGRSRLQ
jgi:amino acid transporter